jgi:hypothetical protein
VLVLLLLALTPPFLNVNRLQRRIAASMSVSLGRPVHLDSVSVHLLPVPGFTLENLVVSEDPAFGDEPVIRANRVEITLRPSSLWRHQVELSSVRFVVDDNGSGPSLNLVRNAEGRWNLQSLLMHAASVNTAPTAQKTAGPAPRFPYIEATGARVNVKLGVEKMPFSLTDADFALWLPTPEEWRVRLEAKPARTDENISDPGTIKLEGGLQRAAVMSDVPVELTANWQGAPLGEASRLLGGVDAGWRGKLNVDATLSGKLGAAKLTTRVHLDELRRADFVPVRTLELEIDCGATADVPAALATAPACKLSAPDEPGLLISASADRADLSRLSALNSTTGLRFETSPLPERWLLDWARLFTQRIPPQASGTGNLAASFALQPAQPDAPAFWQGSARGDVGLLPGLPAPATPLPRLGLLVTAGPDGATLQPLNLMPAGPYPPLLLSATATRAGYSLRLAGTATMAQLTGLLASMPPLADGIPPALPDAAGPSDKPIKLDLTCERPWRGPQTCAPTAVEPVKKKHRRPPAKPASPD